MCRFINPMDYTYKKIWLINLPVMMSILIEQLIHITDAVFLGHIGEVELGASALAGIWFLAVYMFGFGFSLGLQVVIARRNGEQRFTDTGRAFFQGLFFLCVMAVVLCIASRLLSPILLKRLITSAEIYRATNEYLDWRIWGLLFSFPFLAFRAFLVGITRTTALTAAAVTAVFINISGNCLFLFVMDLGIAGAALASSLAELFSLAVLLFSVRHQIDKNRYGLHLTFDKEVLKHIFRVSVWSMFHSFISVAPWFLFFVAIEHTGETELAVANIIRSVSTVFFVIVNSFAATTGSLVSNLIGENKEDKIFVLCRRIIRLGYAIGFPLVFFAWVFHRSVIDVYTNNPILIQEAGLPYLVMLLNYGFALPGYVYINAVTGTGATKTAFAFQSVTILFYSIYLWVISGRNVPLAVFWTAEYVFVILLGIQSIIYLKRKHFKIDTL